MSDDTNNDIDGNRMPDANGRLRGVIKSWRENGAYGFIAPGDGGRDLFVHISEVEGGHEPRAGDAVSFIVGVARDGRSMAAAVTVHREASGPAADHVRFGAQ